MSAHFPTRMTVADYAKLAQPTVEVNNWRTPSLPPPPLSLFSNTVQFQDNPNQNQNNYQSNFGSNWRSTPGFGWENHCLFQNSSHHSSMERKTTLEDMIVQQSQMMSKFIERTETRVQDDQLKFEEQEARIHNQGAVLQSLERTVGQLAELIQERTCEDLPDLVSTWSGKSIDVEEPVGAEEEPVDEALDMESTPDQMHATMLSPTLIAQTPELDKKAQPVEVYKPHIPHPNPRCVEFLKDMLTNITTLERFSTVVFAEKCSAVFPNKLPQKIADTGSFTFPCLLGDVSISNTPANLGTSINLIPYTVLPKLDLGEPQPTYMNLLLEEQSVKYPQGFTIRVVNYFISDIDEDVHISLILSRSLLATAHTLINDDAGVLTIRMNDGQVICIYMNK